MTNSLGLFLMVEGSKVFTGFFSLKVRSSGVVGVEIKSSVNYEYILLGYDELPILKGRTPIQCYADFMRSFKESFQDLHGETIVMEPVDVRKSLVSDVCTKLTTLRLLSNLWATSIFFKFELGSLTNMKTIAPHWFLFWRLQDTMNWQELWVLC
ncbi:hypothetical protein SUGI_0776350 [Cryptomeria japonica]|nr:hypothetical protein SUGI_0776350 [Cryptomeria japonica]